MSHKIFISYSKQEPQLTTELAAFIKAQGYAVWWDTQLISGEDYRHIIDRELDCADAVIVIWSAGSVTSRWVIAEADHAERRGKLIPLRTRELNLWQIPKPYSTYHTDFIDDRAAVLAAIGRVVGSVTESPPSRPDSRQIATGGDDHLFLEVERIGTPDAFRYYLQVYPNGAHASRASVRISEFGQPQRQKSGPIGTVKRTGRVKWYNHQKGYGFLIPDDGGEDIFLHHRALEHSDVAKIQEGQGVEFVAGPDSKGRAMVTELRVLG